MAALTPAPGHRVALRARLEGARLVVVAFCAAWCGTCREFEAAFAALARERPETLFVWLDIEEHAGLIDDLEVETFPTLAIYRAGETIHFGASLPHAHVVSRLVDALAQAPSRVVPAPQAVRSLPERLAA